MGVTRKSRVIDLTLGEVLDAVEDRVRELLTDTPKKEASQPGKYVYGLQGLADLLGCSKTTASRLKTSGVFDDAITQIGALIIIDAEKAIEIAARKDKRNTKK